MKKFVSKMLAGALGLSMLCGVAAAEGETYVSWYTFGDVYLSSVRTALDAAMEAKGLTVVDKDSNANQQTQTDDINTALVTGANAIVVNLVESGAIGTAVAINEMPGQHLLEVAREGQEGTVLIPVVDEFLEGVDEQTRCIYVNVPQGLLDL